MALPGSNLDLPSDRGVGVMLYLSGTSFNSLEHAIEADFIKDIRVLSVVANVIANPLGSAFPYTINIQVEVSTGVLGFSFGWSNQGVIPFT